MTAHLKAILLVMLIATLGLWNAGCSQTTYKASTYRQTVTTQIEITTNVPAEVQLSKRVVGTTPVVFPFNYEEEVDRQVKTANYWETNPGTAAALTVLSFGAYLPFSFIPAEPTSEARPAGRFVNNTVTLRLAADGFEPLEHIVEGKGERCHVSGVMSGVRLHYSDFIVSTSRQSILTTR